MQYISVALLAFAMGTEATPAGRRWQYPSDFSGALAAPAAAGYGLFPTATAAVPTGIGAGYAAPTGLFARAKKTSTKASTKTSSSSDDDDDDDEDDDDDDDEDGNQGATSTAADEDASSTTSTKAKVTTSTSTATEAAAAPGGALPASSGTSELPAVRTIAAGESFDGGMVMFDRGVSCTGQAEGGDSDAVFEIEDGGSISNVIIGPNQIEGIHCFGSCTLTNVWWSAVCEDAFTIKEQDAGATTHIIGGGAFGAEDKVLQHNGGGTMSVSGFTVDTFGKLYRACGNCKASNERHVIFDNISATNGKSLAGINSNFGDTATFTNIKASGVSDICVEYEGTTPGNEPEEISSGPSSACIYTTSDISS